ADRAGIWGNAAGCALPAPSKNPNPSGRNSPADDVCRSGAAPAEWVEDCWNESYRGAPKDGTAWNTGQCGMRVLRGGPVAGKRWRYDRSVPIAEYGFRVARYLD